MDLRAGIRVRARGLAWNVIGVDGVADHERVTLRCIEGDMEGLVWEIHVPLEPLELIDEKLDHQNPAAVAMWHTMHRARVLNQLPGDGSFAVRNPGRVRIEPYQLVPLMRALDMARPRLLLADGVGLGKTIQAGLIAAELIARRRAHRILIVVPSGPLLLQWEHETRLRFGLKFTLITSAAELWEVRRASQLGANPFDTVSLCITALDFAKQDQVLEELERSSWDLVIIDEAHHCAGTGAFMSQENTYRRRLAEVLARRSDGLLLLTATPHDGHEAHFASLVELLDPSLVDGAGGFVGRDYRRHVIRRMKVHIRDPRTGAPLFKRRHVVQIKVDVAGAENDAVRDFHRALSAFVVPRLRRRAGSDDALAFVTLLKRSVSTIAACLATLRVVVERLARQQSGEVETNASRRERARALRAWRRRSTRFGTLGASDAANQEALEIESITEALRINPTSEPARLIGLAVAAEAHDPKLSAIILEVRLIRLRHPRANILIYTEYTDSQLAATHALRNGSGIAGEVLSIGGQDEDHVRAAAAQRFAESDSLILVSTDSLAEGLNLHHHCFHLIHLDLPYNPNRLEQRNGRIDRYGQQQEPEIRYLYIAGTFEENLLLHLIAKYEKARSSLDVMPDTLGVTADECDFGAALTGGLSEEPADLFQPDGDTIRSLDRAVSETDPKAVAELMREIDRAFDAFDLMAVSHGWYGQRGLNAGLESLEEVTRLCDKTGSGDDLTDFVGSVIEAETGKPSIASDRLSLPATWLHDLDGLPGFDPSAGMMRFTRDADIGHDPPGLPVGNLGRAHPLVLRAIRHGCQLPGAVAACHGEQVGLLLTFEMEIAVAGRIAFREIIAVLARPNRPPEEIQQWLAQDTSERLQSPESIWDFWLASWGPRARLQSNSLVSEIASVRHAAFLGRHLALQQEQTVRLQHWLRTRADRLCGPFVAPTDDLFGQADTAPDWRSLQDPATRLVLFATSPDTGVSKRRDANDTLEFVRSAASTDATPGPIVSRPIGMLMLVPRDAA